MDGSMHGKTDRERKGEVRTESKTCSKNLVYKEKRSNYLCNYAACLITC